MLRKTVTMIMLGILLLTFSAVYLDVTRLRNDETKEYYIKNTYEQTGSKNFVTGIYLDYRLFDSIFEAGILLITVTGIAFMTKKEKQKDE
jgi:multisubunit Na+/H+ antiporter MnhB subunit